jgi:hypothetical protein
MFRGLVGSTVSGWGCARCQCCGRHIASNRQVQYISKQVLLGEYIKIREGQAGAAESEDLSDA